jgi:DNA/RNA-binding domain of Phe-tRNA-synthetase-like protein
MFFSIQKELFDILPDLTIGMVVAKGVDNTHPSQEIAHLLTEAVEEVKKNFIGDKAQEHPRIKPWRTAFSKLGISGSKFPSSIESMARRILKGDPFPNINPLVDLYNSISLKFLVPMGGHDLDTLEGNIHLRFAEGGEPLLRFDLIKKVIKEYPQLRFVIVTNGTLITDEIKDFLIKNTNTLFKEMVTFGVDFRLQNAMWPGPQVVKVASVQGADTIKHKEFTTERKTMVMQLSPYLVVQPFKWLAAEGFYNLELMLKDLLAHGVCVSACRTCSTARGLTEQDFIEGSWKIGTMNNALPIG